MSFKNKDRKNRPLGGKDIPNELNSQPILSNQYSLEIAQALRRDFGDSYAALKKVVAITGANERSVKNWWAAKNGPSGAHLINLIRFSDEVLETVLEMAGRNELLKAKSVVDAKNDLKVIHDRLALLLEPE